MTTRRFVLLIASLFVAMVLTSCSLGPKVLPHLYPPTATPLDPPDDTPVPTPFKPTAAPATAKVPTPADVPTARLAFTKVPQLTAVPTEGCSNPYFPVSPKNTWTYAFTSPLGKPHTTVRTLLGVSPTGFVVQDTFGTAVKQVKWSCKNGDLIMLQSAKVTLAGDTTQIDANSSHATGVFLPADPAAAKTWQEGLGMVVTGDVDGKQKLTQSDNNQITCAYAGQSDLKLALGTVATIKVTCDYAMQISTAIQDDNGNIQTTNSTVSLSETDWYAAGIGLVQMERTGDIPESDQLVSYSVK